MIFVYLWSAYYEIFCTLVDPQWKSCLVKCHIIRICDYIRSRRIDPVQSVNGAQLYTKLETISQHKFRCLPVYMQVRSAPKHS